MGVIDRSTLDFMLFDWLGVESLCARPRFGEHERDTFAAAIDIAERIAANHFAPHRRTSDVEEPVVRDGRVILPAEVAQALAVMRDMGLFAPSQDKEIGGLQLPYVVAQACVVALSAANPSTTGYALLTGAAANLLLAYGSPAQQARLVRPMLEGRFFGTMCLSEPHAGSSLGDVRTRAFPQSDGSYRLYGDKMWISGGDHSISENIIHLVLARIDGAPEGVKGLSLFAAPKLLLQDEGRSGAPNDIALVGLNHKMGFRGLSNCALRFGESEGAVAELVGEAGQGLACMFHMMNEVRLATGLNAVAAGWGGLLRSVDYANTRTQGRPAGGDPLAPPVAIVEHADVRRMLLAQKAYVEGGLALVLYVSMMVDQVATGQGAEHEEAALLLDLLTPIVKAYVSDTALRANDLAIQVHGGAGYTRDFDVEMLYRDNRLNPIHEGTNGIQAIDLLGRRVRAGGGQAFALLRSRIQQVVDDGAGDADLSLMATQLHDALAQLETTTHILLTHNDPPAALGLATPYLEQFGAIVFSWLWLSLALTDRRSGGSKPGAANRLAACRYWFAWELPRATALTDPLRILDGAWLEAEFLNS